MDKLLPVVALKSELAHDRPKKGLALMEPTAFQ